MNNFFPQNNYVPVMHNMASYQQPVIPNYINPQDQKLPHPSNSNIIWVQGIEAAKAYEVLPSTSVILMDSESETFYIKSCDETRRPTLRVYEYKQVENNKPDKVSATSDFVSRKEFDELKQTLDSFIKNNREESKNEQSTISNADIPYGIREIRQ